MAGDAELATPRQGLSLGQRRVLALLQNPAAVDELAQQNRLEPEKLARDLTRLAELRLVLLQGPTIPSDPAAAAPAAPARATDSMAPVVLGDTTRRLPMLPLTAVAAAVLLAAVVWYGTRPGDSNTPTTKAQSAVLVALPAATAPSPAPPDARAVTDAGPYRTEAVGARQVDAIPANAVVLRGSAAARDAQNGLRPGSPGGGAQVITRPVAAPTVPERVQVPVPEPSLAVATPAPTVNAPVATGATAPGAVPLSGSTPVAESSPPVQLAAAAPTLTAPRPTSSELKAISRDPPDFPKEAIAEGLTSGIVSARIHVDARGNVNSVDILGSQPPRVFDRAVRKALLRWQFEPSAAGHIADVDVKFQRD